MVASVTASFSGSGGMSSQEPITATLRDLRPAILSAGSVCSAPLASTTTASRTSSVSLVARTAKRPASCSATSSASWIERRKVEAVLAKASA
jgi:hypothetical protein